MAEEVDFSAFDELPEADLSAFEQLPGEVQNNQPDEEVAPSSSIQNDQQSKISFDQRYPLAEEIELRTLGGMARTPEDKLNFIKSYTGDKNAKLLPNGDIKFFDPKKGKEVSYNNQGGFIGDIAEYEGTALNFLFNLTGGALGTAAAAPTGFPLAGSAIGAELGNQIWEQYTRDMGIPDKRNMTERMVDAGTNIILDMATGKLLDPLIDKGLRSTEKFFNNLRRKVFSPVEEIYDAFINSDVSPEGAVTAITESPTIRKALKIFKQAPFSKAMREAEEKTRLDIGEQVKKIVSKTGQESKPAIDVGTGVSQSIDDFSAMIGGKLGKRRAILSKQLGENKIKLEKTTPFILDVIKDYQGMNRTERIAKFPRSFTDFLDQATDQMTRIKSEKSKAFKKEMFLKQNQGQVGPEIMEALEQGFGFDYLVELRSSVMKEQRRAEKAGQLRESNFFQEIANSLKEDIEDTLRDKVSDQAARVWVKSNDEFGIKKEFLEKQLRPFQKGSGEETYKNLISQLRSNPVTTRQRLKKLPKEAREELSRGYLDSILSKSGSQDAFGVFDPDSFFGRRASETFDINHFTKNYSKLTKDQKVALLNNNQELVKELDKFNSFMSLIKETDRSIIDSGTPAGNLQIKLLEGALLAGTGTYSVLTSEDGSIDNAALSAMGIMGGLYLNSKLMTNPSFVRLLTKGLKEGDMVKKAKPFFQSLSNLARKNPSIRQDLNLFIKDLREKFDYESGKEVLKPEIEKAKNNSAQRKFRERQRPQREAEMLGARG